MSQGNSLYYSADPELFELLEGIGDASTILAVIAAYLVIVLLVQIIMGLIARRVTKNRGRRGGFWWGFCLGVVGIIVAAIRPKE